MTDLHSLLARLEAASGPRREIDALLSQHAPAYTASLDAAIALCEHALPGWEFFLTNEGEPANQWVANVGPRDTFASHAAKSSGPALALCIAIVKALIAQQKDKQDE